MKTNYGAIKMEEQPIKIQRDGIRTMLRLAELQLREDKDIPAALETLSVLHKYVIQKRHDGTTLH